MARRARGCGSRLRMGPLGNICAIRSARRSRAGEPCNRLRKSYAAGKKRSRAARWLHQQLVSPREVRGRMRCGVWPAITFLVTVAAAQHSHKDPAASIVARYDGADWHLKGEGVVCCPCPTPCPCRTNGNATYGHCERTLAVRMKDGHYGDTSLKGLKWVNTGGACSANYTMRSASYFDVSSTAEQRAAFMKVFASFYPTGT